MFAVHYVYRDVCRLMVAFVVDEVEVDRAGTEQSLIKCMSVPLCVQSLSRLHPVPPQFYVESYPVIYVYNVKKYPGIHLYDVAYKVEAHVYEVERLVDTVDEYDVRYCDVVPHVEMERHTSVHHFLKLLCNILILK